MKTVTDNVLSYFQALGFGDKETKVLLAVYQKWRQPASAISRVSGVERVTTYNILAKLLDLGIISSHTKSGTKQFWINSLDEIKLYATSQQQKRQRTAQEFDTIKAELESTISPHHTHTPNIHLYEWSTQLKKLFGDMQTQITQQQLLSIKVFGTHTFQEQVTAPHTVDHFAQEFGTFIHNKNISITSHIAMWGLVLEQLAHYEWYEHLAQLPAGDNAINIFLVGQIAYIVIYKGQPVGLKIESPELCWALHFVLDQTR